VWWIEPDGRRFRGHAAVARALKVAGGGWRLIGTVVGSRTLEPLTERIYDWVAHNRHRLPGGTPACRMDSRP
jgi:predicted DCC family thiol-disulfide oxidoreductase YuxK